MRELKVRVPFYPETIILAGEIEPRQNERVHKGDDVSPLEVKVDHNSNIILVGKKNDTYKFRIKNTGDTFFLEEGDEQLKYLK